MAATPLRVEEHDSPLRYLVCSESRPDEHHLVELYFDKRLNRVVYRCSCEDYSFRHESRILAGGTLRGNSCKHVKAVAEHIKWRSLEALVRMYSDGRKPV